MTATPKITTIRTKLFELLIAKLVGPSSSDYWFDSVIAEGLPDMADAQVLSKPVVYIQRGAVERQEGYLGVISRRKLSATFVIRGQVDSATNRTDIERLEHDVFKALASNPDLDCDATTLIEERVEYTDDISTAEQFVRRSAFELTLTVSFVEDV